MTLPTGMNVQHILLGDCGLGDSDIAVLRKGNYHTVADILLASTQDIAKRCKSSPLEIKRIVEVVLQATPRYELNALDSLSSLDEERFTTGDVALDNALAGGMRTGMIWEVVGESSAGKTQFALQVSLFIQAPRNMGGLDGSTCYLTTSSKLPTARLLQMLEAHELLSPSFCGLEHIHTIAIQTVDVLQRVITSIFPAFIEQQASKPGAKRVKLLVIDALAELFHSADKTSTLTLVERSRHIASLVAALHELASKHKIAILVLNEVIDRFDHSNSDLGDQEELLYKQQSRWFNTGEYFGDKIKEASLGLVWANQVNARIMLSRTGRRRYLDDNDFPKRARVTTSSTNDDSSTRGDAQVESQPTLVRRLSVIFSNVSLPVSLDYIVTEKGISVLANRDTPFVSSSSEIPDTSRAEGIPHLDNVDNTSELTAAATENHTVLDGQSVEEKMAEMDEFDNHLWSHAESYENLDWDLLEEQLSQTHDPATTH